MNSRLWKVRADVSIPPDGADRAAVGFMNIVTWADSSKAAEKKIATYFESFGWHIIEFEETTVLEPEFIADNDEFDDMIERARDNPNAIILGTLHTYKTN